MSNVSAVIFIVGFTTDEKLIDYYFIVYCNYLHLRPQNIYTEEP